MNKKTQQVLKRLEKTLEDFWNVRPATGALMNMLVKITSAKRIVEVGTSNGYSTIWLAEAVAQNGQDGKVTTVEAHEGRHRLALKNLAAAGVAQFVDAHLDDAKMFLREVRGKIDFIFIDAEKSEYKQYLETLWPRLKVGGVVVADNVGHFADRMPDFLKKVKTDPAMETIFLPVLNAEGNHDAISISRKIS